MAFFSRSSFAASSLLGVLFVGCGGSPTATTGTAGLSHSSWTRVEIAEGPFSIETPCHLERFVDPQTTTGKLITGYSCDLPNRDALSVQIFAGYPVLNAVAANEAIQAERPVLLSELRAQFPEATFSAEIARLTLNLAGAQTQVDSVLIQSSQRLPTGDELRTRTQHFLFGTHRIALSLSSRHELSNWPRFVASLQLGEVPGWERFETWSTHSAGESPIRFDMPGRPVFEAAEPGRDERNRWTLLAMQERFLFAEQIGLNGLDSVQQEQVFESVCLVGVEGQTPEVTDYRGWPSCTLRQALDETGRLRLMRRVVILRDRAIQMHFEVHKDAPPEFDADGQRFFDSLDVPRGSRNPRARGRRTPNGRRRPVRIGRPR